MRHRFQRALRADRDKRRGFYRPVGRRYLAHSRPRAFRLVQDFEREERFRGVRGEVVAVVGAVVVSSRQRSAAKKNTNATRRTTTSIREVNERGRRRRRGDGSFGQTNRRRRRRRFRRGERCCFPQREAHFQEKEVNECEESRKIQKIFFSLQPKECFQIYQFFFKEREKSFLQNSSQYSRTRTRAHTHESVERRRRRRRRGCCCFWPLSRRADKVYRVTNKTQIIFPFLCKKLKKILAP